MVSLPSERFARFGNPAWPGIRTANFAAFGPWSGVLPKNAESLRDSDALMRIAVPRRRGPAGLRDPVAVSLTAPMGFSVLVSRFVGTQKIERLFFSYSGAFFEPLFASIHARNLSVGTTIRLPILSVGNLLPCTSSYKHRHGRSQALRQLLRRRASAEAHHSLCRWNASFCFSFPYAPGNKFTADSLR